MVLLSYLDSNLKLNPMDEQSKIALAKYNLMPENSMLILESIDENFNAKLRFQAK